MESKSMCLGMEAEILESLIQKEGECHGLSCQHCPIFDKCECDSRAEILAAAISARAEIKNNDKNKHRTVRWISKKSGKTLTGLLVAEVSGMAIIVSMKDTSRVISVRLDKLIK